MLQKLLIFVNFSKEHYIEIYYITILFRTNLKILCSQYKTENYNLLMSYCSFIKQFKLIKLKLYYLLKTI